jgi:predicted hotdog family 3-hydroxylacyl-ACP dehydratase
VGAQAASVRDLVPHRPPILCLDALLEAGDTRAAAELVVADGLFLDAGALSEQGFVEGLAQTAAALMTTRLRAAGAAPRGGYLVGVRDLRIRRRPGLGERVRFDVELVTTFGGIAVVRGEVAAGGETLGAGELRFFVES